MHRDIRYQGHAFHTGFAKGKQSGEFWFDGLSVHYCFGDKQGSLSLQEMALRLGGARNRLVFFSHPSEPDLEFYTVDRSVLQAPAIQDTGHLAQQAGIAKRQRLGQHSRLLLGLLLIVVLPVAVLFRMDVLAKPVADKIPVEWELSLAEAGMAQYQLSNELMDAEQAEALLSAVVAPLLSTHFDSPYTYTFYIVNDASLNAFALPGGIIVIHSGLILEAGDVSQLQGVLAHEISHVEEKHGLRNVLSSLGVYTLVSAALGDASGVLATLGAAAPFLLNQQYSRRFETEADKKAHQRLVLAEIDPEGLASFFELMIEREEALLNGVDDENTRLAIETTMGFLSTHPSSRKRIEALRAMPVPSHIPFRDDSDSFAVLRTAVAQFVSEPNLQQEQILNENGH